MVDDSRHSSKLPSAEAERRQRLAKALRENLKRRKSQSRGRLEDSEPASRPEAEPKQD